MTLLICRRGEEEFFFLAEGDVRKLYMLGRVDEFYTVKREPE